MVIEALLALIPTALLVTVGTGVLWAVAWSIPPLLARYRSTVYSSAPLLQALILLGGLALISQLMSVDVATAMAAILAVLWCGSIIRETYRRATDHTPVAPATESLSGGVSAPTQAAATKIFTNATASSAHVLPHEPLAADAPAEEAEATAQMSKSPVLGSSSAWVDLSQRPSRPLSKRPPLGKQTVEAFRSTM